MSRKHSHAYSTYTCSPAIPAFILSLLFPPGDRYPPPPRYPLSYPPQLLSSKLCTGQIEASTSPPGIPRAFDCGSCPGRGEFERCLGRVGNLNQIYLLF